MHFFNQGLTRRRALALGAGAVLASNHSAAQAASRSIIVIGAGLSGLAAARGAQDEGAQVTVLEARDRIGGRIWTSHVWKDLPIDMGASWIHGVEDNPISALADEAGVRRVGTSYDSSLSLNAEGQVIDLDAEYKGAKKLVTAALKAADSFEHDVSLKAAIEASKGWQKADEAARRAVRQYVNDTMETEYGGDWSELSAWHGDDGDEFDGGDVLMPGGYEQIANFLAKELDVRFNSAVKTIAPDGKGVSVTLANGSKLSADHVIISVPLGALKAGQIQFGEALDGKRQTAIDTLRMGLLNKCWLRFDKITWPADVDWITWQGPKPGIWPQWLSLAHALKAPVLLGFHGGDQARALEKQNDADVSAAAQEALKAMFGSSFPAPIAMQMSRWSQDALTLGAYSFNAVGVSAKTRQHLAGTDWDGRIAFAGEATHRDHFGTAHGAVLSGRAAVKALLG